MSNKDNNHFTTNEARAGRKVKGMTLVLGVSTVAAVVLVFIVLAFFAGK